MTRETQMQASTAWSGPGRSDAESWSIDGDSEATAFRAAMRRLVGAVTVITTRHDDRTWGMTVNAFTSVCAEPPTVLVCVNTRTVTAADIERDRRFAANVLSQDQLYLSRLCSRPGEVKFLDDHVLNPDELPCRAAMPVLRDSLVTFDCKVAEARPVGTHFVVIGTVEAILAPSVRPPLLYGGGRYMHGVEIEDAPAMAEARSWM